jgi:CRP-like cAMP-binding protein
MSVRASAETLKRIPIFRECDAVPLQVLAFAAPQVTFREGDYIVDEADTARAAFFLVSGSADIRNAEGPVAIAEPGTLIGEVAMIAGTRYSVSAVAREPVVTSCIDYQLFLRVTGEYPEFGRAVMHALSERLERSMRDFDGVRVMLSKIRAFSDV